MCALMAAVLALLVGSGAWLSLGPEPSQPVAASPAQVAVVACPAPVSIDGSVPFGVLDGSMPQAAGWGYSFVLGPNSPSWYLTAPGRRAWLRVFAWPADEVLFAAEALASPGTSDLGLAWAPLLHLDVVGTTVVRLGDGRDRTALRVEGPSGKNDAIQGGILTAYRVGDDTVAVIALADRDCLPAMEPQLRTLMAAVEPPTERLVPTSTPLIIEIGGSPAP